MRRTMREKRQNLFVAPATVAVKDLIEICVLGDPTPLGQDGLGQRHSSQDFGRYNSHVVPPERSLWRPESGNTAPKLYRLRGLCDSKMLVSVVLRPATRVARVGSGAASGDLSGDPRTGAPEQCPAPGQETDAQRAPEQRLAPGQETRTPGVRGGDPTHSAHRATHAHAPTPTRGARPGTARIPRRLCRSAALATLARTAPATRPSSIISGCFRSETTFAGPIAFTSRSYRRCGGPRCRCAGPT